MIQRRGRQLSLTERWMRFWMAMCDVWRVIGCDFVLCFVMSRITECECDQWYVIAILNVM